MCLDESGQIPFSWWWNWYQSQENWRQQVQGQCICPLPWYWRYRESESRQKRIQSLWWAIIYPDFHNAKRRSIDGTCSIARRNWCNPGSNRGPPVCETEIRTTKPHTTHLGLGKFLLLFNNHFWLLFGFRGSLTTKSTAGVIICLAWKVTITNSNCKNKYYEY